MLAELVIADARTICFVAQPQGHRADPAVHGDAPRRARPRRPRRRGSLPTGPATRRSSGARSSAGSRPGELSAVVATNALELGIDIGELDAAICVTLPRHRRQPAADVGEGRAARREGLAIYMAGRTASTSSSAATRRSSSTRPGRGGDPRPHERADQRRPPARRLVRVAARRPVRRRGARRGLARAGRGARRRRPPAPGQDGPDRRPRPRLRGRRDQPALLLAPTRSRSSTQLRRAARHGRGRARLLDRPPGRHLPAHGPLLRGPRARRRGPHARSSSRSTATGTRRPARRPTSTSSGRWRCATRSAWSSTSASSP